MTATLDLDLLLDELAVQLRGWTAALDEAGLKRAEGRARRPGWLARLEAQGAAAEADPSDAALVPVVHYGIASFGLDAEVQLATPAGPFASPIRFALSPPGVPPAPHAVTLQIRLDAAANGMVRLGPWQAAVGAGRRLGAWQKPIVANDAAPSSAAGTDDPSRAGESR